MPITFTPQQRLDITRRQIKIAQENAAFAKTTAQLTDQQIALLNVDSANAAFYDFYKAQVSAYENEVRAINGLVAAEYSDGSISPYVAGDMATSAKFPAGAGATFFPPSPSTYEFLIPQIIAAINGYANPTSTDARYEQNILTNTDITNGFNQVVNFLLNGITGGTTGNTTILTPGFTPTNVTVTSITGFSVNDIIYISDNTNSGIYKITNINPEDLLHLPLPTPASFDITPLFPSAGTPAIGGSIKNTVPGFTNTERTNGTSTVYQEIYNSLTAKIIALVAEWLTKVNAQITQLGLQNDTRATQFGQNAAAQSTNLTAQVTITTWQGLSNTGANGKFTDLKLNPLQSFVTARLAALPTRITQVVTALGNVVDNGDGTYTGVITSSYLNRYKWLDFRINRGSGSARRYFNAGSGVPFLNSLSASNTAIAGEYDAYFLTKQITQNDGEIILFVADITGLSVSDTITVVSETQPEISRTIIQLFGNNQVQLSATIPITYITDDVVRLFKTL